MNGEDDLENRRRLTGSTRGVLRILKHPHLAKTEKLSPQNAVSAAMVPDGERQHVLKKEHKR